MKLSRLVIAVCLTVFMGTLPGSAQVLSGRVFDYRQSTKSQRVAVSGVRVSIFQGEKRIGEPEVTGTNGLYSFAKVPLGVPLRIEFDRVGYLRYPTVRNIKIDKSPFQMADLFLLKKEDAASSDAVAARFLDRLTWEGVSEKTELEILTEFGLEEDQRKAILARVETLRSPERVERAHAPGPNPAQAPAQAQAQAQAHGSKTLNKLSRKPSVAVLAFENKAENQWWHLGGAEAAQDVLVTELIKSGTFRVVERKQLAFLLQEKKLTLSDNIDPATAARAGKLLGVSYLLVGSVTEYGSTGAQGGAGGMAAGKNVFVAAMNARLIDCNTGKIVWADEVRTEEASVKVSVSGVGGGVDDERMFDKVLKPAIQQLAASLKAAALH